MVREDPRGGREGEWEGVPRSLGHVLDDKRGIRGVNSGRRRRDVQNMNEMKFFLWKVMRN